MMNMNDFLSRIIVNQNNCWEWTGRKAENGYGLININNHNVRVHRLVFQVNKGNIPKELVIDHLCRNPCCCNPDHMELVTIGENVLRGIGPAAINKRKTHCDKGHELTGDNLYLPPDNKRRCKICRRIQDHKRYPRIIKVKIAKNLNISN